MGKLGQAKSSVYELRCLSRMAKYLPRFAPPGMPWTMSRHFDERVAEDPNGLALAYQDQRFTFRDLDRKVNQVTRFLMSRGIGRSDVVVLLMDNRPEFVFVLLALGRLRAVASLINTNLSGPALVHAVNVCSPKAAVVGSEHAAVVSEVRDQLLGVQGRLWFQAESTTDETPAGFERINESVLAQADARPAGLTKGRNTDTALYIYTSGTTGLPKAAIVNQRRWMAAAYFFGVAAMDASSRDVVYVPLPLYHSNAVFGGLGSCLVSGAALALRRKFSASRFWDDVHEFDASHFMYIGELCRYLLNAPKSPNERNHHVRVAVGNGLRKDIWREFQQRFGVPMIREFYGATEGNALIVNFEGRAGMIGRLKPGQVLVRCDESTGEILRGTPGFCEEVAPGQRGILLVHINPLFSFEGYVDKAATKKKILQDVFKPGDAYFNSGDLLELHDDGWASFADRVGDTFRWKGENVSTNEVAELLNRADGVLESNVYGVQVPGTEGRAGMASINADGGFDLGQFGSYVATQLPAYQRPYFLRVQSDMRVTGTFKHQKVTYRDEGYDPSKVSDPLYFLDGDRYVPIDGDLYKRLESGDIGPR